MDGLVCSLPLPAGFYLMILAGFKTADYSRIPIVGYDGNHPNLEYLRGLIAKIAIEEGDNNGEEYSISKNVESL